MQPPLLDPADPRAPKYWQYETGGLLARAVRRYLGGAQLRGPELALMRAYVRQWIDSPVWDSMPSYALGAKRTLADLRFRAAVMRTQEQLTKWIADAEAFGVDPL